MAGAVVAIAVELDREALRACRAVEDTGLVAGAGERVGRQDGGEVDEGS